VDKIIESGNHYLIQVKGNQAALQETIIKQSQATPFTDRHVVEESDRGSKKTWDIQVFEAIDEEIKKKWTGLQRYVIVSKTEIKDNILTHYKRYFITDHKQLTAKQLAEGIRKHWHIENKLHRTRDMLFNQDNNKIATITGAINMATMNTIAINCLKEIDKSVRVAQMTIAANYQELLMKWRT
jgi:predicted transposase YbfD/YdcC